MKDNHLATGRTFGMAVWNAERKENKKWSKFKERNVKNWTRKTLLKQNVCSRRSARIQQWLNPLKALMTIAIDTEIDKSPRTRSHHRLSKPGTAFILHNIMKHPRNVELATCLIMTPSLQDIYTIALIEKAQGDNSKVSTSYPTTGRSHCKATVNVHAHAHKDTPRRSGALEFKFRLVKVGSQRLSKPQSTLT